MTTRIGLETQSSTKTKVDIHDFKFHSLLLKRITHMHTAKKWRPCSKSGPVSSHLVLVFARDDRTINLVKLQKRRKSNFDLTAFNFDIILFLENTVSKINAICFSPLLIIPFQPHQVRSTSLLKMQLPLNSSAYKVPAVLAESKGQFPLKKAQIQCWTCYQLQKQLLC